jgi:diguanylate cyclase (GGDEF)-like protein
MVSCLLFAPVALFALLAGLGFTEYHWAKDTVLFNVPFALAFALALRHSRASADRTAWLLIAVGMALYLAGNVIFDVQEVFSEPLVWWAADVPYLACLPCLYAAIIMIVRSRIGAWQPSIALDGGIIFCGLAAILYQPVYAHLLVSDKSMARALLYSAYPLLDLTLVAIAITASMLVRHGMPRGWMALNVAFISLAIADTYYLTADLTGGYVSGGLWDAAWMFAGSMIAMSAYSKWRSSGVSKLSTGGVFLWPLLVSALVLACLFAEALGSERHTATLLLGLACLTLTLVRVSMTMAESRRMGSTHFESRTDEVTGLGNRRRFDEQLNAFVRVGHPFVLAMVDLDGFKRVNDAFGHDTGDKLLRMVASRMQDIMPESAQCCRIGGDEFALVMSAQHERSTLEMMHQLHDALRAPYKLDSGRQNAQIDASLGVGVWSEGSAAELVKRVDAAMYQSKAEGGGVSLADADTKGRSTVGELEMLQALREMQSLEGDDGIVVYYQPIVATDPSERPGVEALARWRYRGEIISPAVFIPLAEQNGLMQYVTRRVIEQAVHETARMREQHQVDLSVSVNLAVSSLMDPTLLPTIVTALQESGLPAHALKLEITESMVITDPRAAQRTVNALRDLGADILVDDYGTGYASISHLQSLKIDGLKLDRSLVSKIVEDPRMFAIVKATIEMGHALDIKVVGEGVETEGQFDTLTALGCDFIQGFYIARPMGASDLDAWLSKIDAEAEAA